MPVLFHTGLKHNKKAWIVVAFLLIVGFIGISKVTWITDITALLPTNNTSLTLSRRFGMMKQVVVVVGSPKRVDEPLHAALDALAKEIESIDGIAEVLAGVDGNRALRSAEVVMSHGAALFDPEKPLDLDTAKKRLDTLKQKLASPESMILGSYLLKDPFGFSWKALSGIEATGAAMGQVVEAGHILSQDRTHGLLIATIDFDPMDIPRATRFTADLERAIGKVISDDNGLTATALGGVHFAVATASGMMSDISITFALTAVLVLGIFLLFFGRLRMLPVALLPAGVGIAAALGILGLIGVKLHALTLGFAATITGISIDYVIHLFHRATTTESTSSTARMADALAAVGKPIVLGCATTLGAFAIVAFSGFTGIRQLALFSLTSLPIALFTALFAIPGLHGFLLPTKKDAHSGRLPAANAVIAVYRLGRRLSRRIIWGGFIGLFLVMLLLSLRISVSGDPVDLGRPSPMLENRRLLLKKVFPCIFEQTSLVSSGNTLEAALQKNDALYQSLSSHGIDADRIISLSPFLPSRARQANALKTLKSRFSEKNLVQILTAAGFERGYAETIRSSFDTPSISPESYDDTSLAALIDHSIRVDDNGTHILTRVRGSDDKTLEQVQTVADRVGARILSERLEIATTLSRLQQELIWMLGIWLAAALLVLTLVERSFLFGVRAALPALFGVAAAVTLFSLLNRPLTPVASAGITLVMGLGIDYGIFMQHRSGHMRGTAAAVGASGLTTLAAFGVLAISSVRAMSDIGLIILVGLAMAVLTAIVLVPSLGPHGDVKDEI